MMKKITISLLCVTLALPAVRALANSPAKPEARKQVASTPAGDAAFLLARDGSRAGDSARLNRAAASIGDHVLAPYVEF